MKPLALVLTAVFFVAAILYWTGHGIPSGVHTKHGVLMLVLTFAGWLALAQLPVLSNVVVSRLMVHFYLLAGFLVAIWINDLRSWTTGARRLGWVALGASLVLLTPVLPFPSTPTVVPAFFSGPAVTRIPPGSVALVVPYSTLGDSRAMLWQAEAGMRFRMPEGYAFIPDPVHGARLSPPSSATEGQINAVASGRAAALTDDRRNQIIGELRSWHVQTVIIGPLAGEQQEVELFTALPGRAPERVDCAYVWWKADPSP